METRRPVAVPKISTLCQPANTNSEAFARCRNKRSNDISRWITLPIVKEVYAVDIVAHTGSTNFVWCSVHDLTRHETLHERTEFVSPNPFLLCLRKRHITKADDRELQDHRGPVLTSLLPHTKSPSQTSVTIRPLTSWTLTNVAKPSSIQLIVGEIYIIFNRVRWYIANRITILIRVWHIRCLTGVTHDRRSWIWLQGSVNHWQVGCWGIRLCRSYATCFDWRKHDEYLTTIRHLFWFFDAKQETSKWQNFNLQATITNSYLQTFRITKIDS